MNRLASAMPDFFLLGDCITHDFNRKIQIEGYRFSIRVSAAYMQITGVRQSIVIAKHIFYFSLNLPAIAVFIPTVGVKMSFKSAASGDLSFNMGPSFSSAGEIQIKVYSRFYWLNPAIQSLVEIAEMSVFNRTIRTVTNNFI
jgi:hypothetical protein